MRVPRPGVFVVPRSATGGPPRASWAAAGTGGPTR